MASLRILAVLACGVVFAHPTLAASCDLEAEMTEIGQKIGDGQKSEAWFDQYSKLFGSVMKAASAGDNDTACDKLQDLKDWLADNPPQ